MTATAMVRYAVSARNVKFRLGRSIDDPVNAPFPSKGAFGIPGDSQIAAIGEPGRVRLVPGTTTLHATQIWTRYADLAQVVAGMRSSVRDSSGNRRNVADGDSPNSDL